MRPRDKTTKSLLLPLILLFFSLAHCPTSSSSTVTCHDTDRSALLRFKQSFSLNSCASSHASAYPKTQTWKPAARNASDCCLWDGVVCDERSGRVIGLDLSSSYLYGSILPNSTLFLLVHLRSLNLSDNDFRYSLIPSELGRLVNLEYLNLSQSMFSGQVPIEVSTLSRLISLDLSLNLDPSSGYELLKLQSPSFKETVETFTTSLEVLRLSHVNISSTIPENIANLRSLRSLLLYQCGLYGPLPEGIFLLPQLEDLSLGMNRHLSGQISPSIGNLTSLEFLYLNNAAFEGQIPDSLGKLSRLTSLDLSSNYLTGNIPASFSNLTQLQILCLLNCAFEGQIPDSLGKLTRLTFLDLSSNHLTGKVPASLSNLTQLQILRLSYNSLVGEASPLANLTELIYLDINDNRLEGLVGGVVSGLKNLVVLFVQWNNFIGPLEFDMFAGHKNLQALDLSPIDLDFSSFSHNSTRYPQFSYLWLESCNLKRLPDFLYNQTRLTIFSLADNNMQGPLLPPPPSMVLYHVPNNMFSGEIPEKFCNATSLQFLSLENNRLSSGIPTCLFNLSNNNLQTLALSGNNLFGTIPETFTSSCKLIEFEIASNRIHGPIPRSIVNCTSLRGLVLENNSISDTFPLWLSGLPNLQFLSLQTNLIHGPIPAQFQDGFPILHIIYMYNNKLTGNIPKELFQSLHAMQNSTKAWPYWQITVPFFLFGWDLSKHFQVHTVQGTIIGVRPDLIVSIDLSGNALGGNIPDSIGTLERLHSLRLSYNNLTGSIPSSLGSLSNLEVLDLSHNMLSGEIPLQLAGLTFLRSFDVSYNQLVGTIPNGQQFGTFSNDSFVGNPGLCGRPLSRSCGSQEVPTAPKHDEEESSDVIDWVIRFMGYLGGLVVGLILGRIITTENHEWFVKTFRKRRAGGKKKRRKQRS